MATTPTANQPTTPPEPSTNTPPENSNTTPSTPPTTAAVPEPATPPTTPTTTSPEPAPNKLQVAALNIAAIAAGQVLGNKATRGIPLVLSPADISNISQSAIALAKQIIAETSKN